MTPFYCVPFFCYVLLIVAADVVAEEAYAGDSPKNWPYPSSETTIVDVSRITFPTALSRVLSANSRIQQVKHEILAAQARWEQAGYFPDYTGSIETEDFGRRSANGPSQTTVAIRQPLEIWGSRGARKEVAEAERLAAEYSRDEVVAELYRQTSTAFFALLAAQERLANAESRKKVAQQIAEVVRERVQDGAAPISEKQRALVSARLAEIDVDQARTSLTSSQLALAALWGGEHLSFVAEGTLGSRIAVPSFEEVSSHHEHHPSMRRLDALIKVREAELRLARAKQRPEVTIGGGYRRLHDTSENAFIVSAEVSLPRFNLKRASVAEAEARIQSAMAEIQLAKQKLVSEAQQLLISIAAQRTEVQLLESEVLPLSNEALTAVDQAFRQGSQSFLHVLEAQRSVADVQSRLLDAKVALASDMAHLESLIGRSLSDLGS